MTLHYCEPPPHVGILGSAPAGNDVFESECLPQTSQACQSSPESSMMDPSFSFGEGDFPPGFSSVRFPSAGSQGGWVRDHPPSMFEPGFSSDASNLGASGITPIKVMSGTVSKQIRKHSPPLCLSLVLPSSLPVPCQNISPPQAHACPSTFRPIFPMNEQKVAWENWDVIGGTQKIRVPGEFLWLIDGGVEQGLGCPLTPPQSSPEIQDTPAEFEEFCRGASLASVFGDLVISENDPIFPKVSFDMIDCELSGPGDPPCPKIVERTPILDIWEGYGPTPLSMDFGFEFSCDIPSFGMSGQVLAQLF